MSRLFYHVMQDNVGNLLFGVSGTMRLAGSGTLATIYGDEALTVIIPNPMTNHPSYGSFKCFLGAGDYDFYMAKAGYTFETLTGVQGHGTMAQQDAANVTITGGVISGLSALQVSGNETVSGASTMNGLAVNGNASVSGTATVAGLAVTGNATVGGSATVAGLAVTTDANATFGGHVVVAATKTLRLGTSTVTPVLGARGEIHYTAATPALLWLPNTDTPSYACLFHNAAAAAVGSITTTGSATAYNTASDARLKHAIAPLTGALDVVRALKPVHFLWNADDSEGHGFLAHQLQQVVPEAVTGEPDEVNPDGSIKPQGVDHSQLVPWLTAALQEAVALTQALAGQVETLTERVQALETALGV
jgi:hypothetical protein